MPLQQDPRNAISYDWPQGNAGWKQGMDDNLRYIGSMLNVSAIDIQNTPPGSPTNGDTYIVATGTGDWNGEDTNIAIWFNDDTTWRFFTPIAGGNRANYIGFISQPTTSI